MRRAKASVRARYFQMGPEFARDDKLLFVGSYAYIFLFFVVFLIGTVYMLSTDISDQAWGTFWWYFCVVILLMTTALPSFWSVESKPQRALRNAAKCEAQRTTMMRSLAAGLADVHEATMPHRRAPLPLVASIDDDVLCHSARHGRTRLRTRPGSPLGGSSRCAGCREQTRQLPFPSGVGRKLSAAS